MLETYQLKASEDFTFGGSAWRGLGRPTTRHLFHSHFIVSQADFSNLLGPSLLEIQHSRHTIKVERDLHNAHHMRNDMPQQGPLGPIVLHKPDSWPRRKAEECTEDKPELSAPRTTSPNTDNRMWSCARVIRSHAASLKWVSNIDFPHCNSFAGFKQSCLVQGLWASGFGSSDVPAA